MSTPFNQIYMENVGPSNGTSVIDDINSFESVKLIGIANMEGIFGRVVVTESREYTHTNRSFRESLDRSLKENSAIWAELAKY